MTDLWSIAVVAGGSTWNGRMIGASGENHCDGPPLRIATTQDPCVDKTFRPGCGMRRWPFTVARGRRKRSPPWVAAEERGGT